MTSSSATLPSSSASSSVHLGFALFALAMGGFAIGTSEFAIMGLLPDVARDYAVTEARAGQLISAYALGVVVGAPLIAVLGSGLNRRLLALLLMACYAVANIASSLAPGFGSLIVLRFVSGLPHGAYFGVAALIAASMVPASRRGYAVGRVMMGLTVAALAGNPLAVWLGQVAGWRYAFTAVGVIALLTIGLILACLPPLRDEPLSSPRRELGALTNSRVWMTLAIGAIGFGGVFAVMSYIAPALTTVTGLGANSIPIALAVFGAGMLAGSYVGGWAADRALMRSTGLILVWSIAVLLLFPFMLRHPVSAFVGIFLVGSGVALAAPLQVRLMDVAADAQTLAASLNHSAFNAANALGAFLGGMVVGTGPGVAATGWVGALLALGGLAVFGLACLQERRHQG